MKNFGCVFVLASGFYAKELASGDFYFAKRVLVAVDV